MAKAKAAHHRGTHQARARKTVAPANANPGYRCPRCKLTLDQARRRWGSHVHWQAGHINAGEIGGRMRPECSHCNASHGATLGNRRRARKIQRPRAKTLASSGSLSLTLVRG